MPNYFETYPKIELFFSKEGVGFKDLYNFINSHGENISFGYTLDGTIVSGVELVMMLN